MSSMPSTVNNYEPDRGVEINDFFDFLPGRGDSAAAPGSTRKHGQAMAAFTSGNGHNRSFREHGA